MSFLEQLIERENVFLRELRERDGGAPLYIWGAGYGGKNVARLLKSEGISFDGMVVNRRYYDGQEGVRILEEISAAGEKASLIVAFRGFHQKLLEGMEDSIERIFNYDCWVAAQMAEEWNHISYAWVLEHEEELQETFGLLGDDSSRKCFLAFLNQKISMKYGYLSEVKTSCQYFEDGLVRLSDREVFVDCGGYDGDSAAAFVEALRKQGISTWQKIISFEPDPENFARMKARGLPRHCCLQKGAGDREGALYFSPCDRSGQMGEQGEMRIAVDTIDHVAGNEDVTMIKMDIEGAELAALRGAEKTIRRCHPLLAVCIYHKREDLYEIPRLILELYPEYRLYIRAYEDMSVELVLYAVPGVRD